MIDKYGPPQEASATELRRTDVGAGKKVVVRRDAVSPLEETVAYDVPSGKMSPAHAALFFEKTIGLEKADKSSRCTQRLLF